MSNPIVSIIIVNWNVRELLRACIASLYAQGGLPSDAMQVLVVDNASKDGSVAMVREAFPQVDLVANTDNVGFGRANNQVLSACTAPYVLLLNPDTVVRPGAISGLVDKMESLPNAAVIGSRLLNADGSLQRWTGGAYPRLLNLLNHYFFLDRLLPRSLRSPPLYLDHDVQKDTQVDWVSGACMLLRRSALQGKLFNSNYFMYGEDMELCHRLKLAGGDIIYSPAVSIIHYQGESMKQQQGDVLLSSLNGPRQFYRQMRGGKRLRIYDSITVVGFALRWILFSVAGVFRSNGGVKSKSSSSRDMMFRAWKILREN